MAYNLNTDRTAAGDLVPPEHEAAIIKATTQESAALKLIPRLPIITNAKTIPVMQALPHAYFVDPVDTGRAHTTSMTWANVTMNVVDIAVLAPMPKNVLDDVAAGGISLTAEMVPYIAQAAGVLLDGAIFFGTSKPSSWPSAILTAAEAVTGTGTASDNNTYPRGTNSASKGGVAEDINQLMRVMAKQGFRPSALYARSTFEFDLNSARDTTGQKLLDMQAGSFNGRPIMFGGDGVFPEDTGGIADLFAIDQSKFRLGLRKGMEFTVHTEGVINDENGVVIYNLMQQNAICVRLVMRVGFAVGNPVTLAEPTIGRRYPAAVLLSPAS